MATPASEIIGWVARPAQQLALPTICSPISTPRGNFTFTKYVPVYLTPGCALTTMIPTSSRRIRLLRCTPWTQPAVRPLHIHSRWSHSGPVVVGAAVVDMLARPQRSLPWSAGSSMPGTVAYSYGGVARNIAQGIAQLAPAGHAPVLVSVVGSDSLAAGLQSHVAEAGIRAQWIQPGSPSCRTPVYNAMLDDRGDLVAAIADMAALDAVTPEQVRQELASALPRTPMVVLDGNLSHDVLLDVATACGHAGRAGALSASRGQPSKQLDDARRAALLAEAGVPAAQTQLDTAVASIVQPEHVSAASAAFAAQVPGIPVWFEPTSVQKSARGATPDMLARTAVISPNADECVAMAEAATAAFIASGDPVAAQLSAWPGVPPVGAAAGQPDAGPVDKAQRAQSIDLAAFEASLSEPDAQAALAEAGLAAADVLEFVRGSGKQNPDGTFDVSQSVLAMALELQGDSAQQAGGQHSAGGAGGAAGPGGSTAPHARTFSTQAGGIDAEWLPRGLRGDATGSSKPKGQPSKPGTHPKHGARKKKPEPVTIAGSFSGPDGEWSQRVVDSEAGDAIPDDAARGAKQGWAWKGEGDSFMLDATVLAAAQRLLALMCHPAVGQSDVGLVDGEKHVVVTLGELGVLWLHAAPFSTEEQWLAAANEPFGQASIAADFQFTVLSAPQVAAANVTGAGDTLVAATVTSIAAGLGMQAALLRGLAGASLAVQYADGAVPPALGPASPEWHAACVQVAQRNPRAEASPDLLRAAQAGEPVIPEAWAELPWLHAVATEPASAEEVAAARQHTAAGLRRQALAAVAAQPERAIAALESAGVPGARATVADMARRAAQLPDDEPDLPLLGMPERE